MQLEGSCYCGAVKFSVAAYAPVPFLRCYCSICRKSAGGGGYAINLGAKAATMKVTGEKNIGVFHAVIDGKESEGRRHFCKKCGTALWVFDPRWPDLIHPFASAIDSDLPVPPQHVHMMLGSKANWVEPQVKKGDDQFQEYPEQSLEDWHKAHHLLQKV